MLLDDSVSHLGVLERTIDLVHRQPQDLGEVANTYVVTGAEKIHHPKHQWVGERLEQTCQSFGRGWVERIDTRRNRLENEPQSSFAHGEAADVARTTWVIPKPASVIEYFTLASGGYIIRMSPAAIGTEVVPIESRVMPTATPGTK
jgi:hypothetical protein